MKNKIEFRKVREFGEIIGDTFLFIKQNFKPLMKAFIYLCGLFIVGGMLSSFLTQLQMVESTNVAMGRSYGMNRFDMIYNLGFNYILVIVFVMLSYTAMYVSVLSFIALYIQKGNEAPTVPEVWVYFKYYFLRMLGSGLLMSIFLVLCFICCVIPGLYVFPAVSLFYPIMILENGNLSHSFSRSFKLLKDEWWITAATLIVIYIIFYAFSMIIQLPGMLIVMVGTLTHAEQPITKTYAIVSSISQYASQVFLIIPIIGTTLCYFNLLERKENTGLLGRIEDFGNPNPTQFNASPEEY